LAVPTPAGNEPEDSRSVWEFGPTHHQPDEQHQLDDETTESLPRREGARQQGGTSVTAPGPELPPGRGHERWPGIGYDYSEYDYEYDSAEQPAQQPYPAPPSPSTPVPPHPAPANGTTAPGMNGAGGPLLGPVGVFNDVRGRWAPSVAQFRPPAPPSPTGLAGYRANGSLTAGPLGAAPMSAGPMSAGPMSAGPMAVPPPAAGGRSTATLAPPVPAPARPAADHGNHRLGARRANRPVRTASSARAVVTRPAWVLGGWLLRDGVRPLLLGADVISCLIAIAILHRNPHWTVYLFIVLLVGLYGLGGLYRSRLSLSLLDDMPRAVGRWLAAVALTVLVQSARARADYGVESVSWIMVITAMTALMLILMLRAMAYHFVRIVRRQRRVAHRTLILGAGHIGEQIARALLNHSEYGLQPIGFVDGHPLIDPETCAVPLLGGTESLSDVLVREDVRNVVVAFGSVRESQMVDIIRTCDRLRCEIFLVPRLFELHQVGDDMDVVWGLPLVRLRRATYRSHGWHVKRLFDIAFALGSLGVLWPLMVAAAMAVRLEGGPGILFRQERVGADGRRFDVLKFRSLKPATDTESATNWNIKHDDRLGPVGRFLRKSSIDELPQLLNILRGEMSLVGPRPERPHFVAQFRQAYPRYVARHRVPSGLTGWAQVHGLRGDTSIADRAMFDNYYIENWSLWLDVKILIRTIGSVVKGQGG
jgi:exopolysaccharide biosynthesis polyprenyl glycosylphosphotransferase